MVNTMLSKFYKNTISKYVIELDNVPHVYDDAFFKDALDEMIKNKLGIVCIINKKMFLKGILTDGDLRRKLINIQKPFSAFFSDDVKNHMNKKPLTIHNNATVLAALKLMTKNRVWDLPVVDKSKKLKGLLHLNSILKSLY